MVLTGQSITALNDQIEDIGITDVVHHFTLSDLSTSSMSIDFLTTIRTILFRLQFYDTSVRPHLVTDESAIQDVRLI